MPARFPTLAEQLGDRPASDEVDGGGLVVVVEQGEPDELRAAAPAGSLVVVPEALDRLVETVREAAMDVLLVSEGARPSEALVTELRAALAEDSACATVSLAESAPPRLEGIPPRTVLQPGGPLVLVRRGHLLLAADEASLVVSEAESEAAQRPLTTLLAALDRPGFVHRACGPACEPPAAPPEGDVRSVSRQRPRVVIDGRSLAYPLAGTQVQLIGLLGGLARSGADVTVALRDELHPTVRAELGELADALPFAELDRVGRPAIVHKPHQFWSLHDLAESLSLGERLVLTQLDMILERTRAYRRDRAKWDEQRATTAAALASADQVGFLSSHAALDAASDGAVALDRATVVHCGVDHLRGRPVPDPARPLGGRPYLLVVGNAYWHKNRPFAIRLLHHLVERHGWDGGLVLAGGHPSEGGSVDAERLLLARLPSLVERVSDLGHVSDEERLALYAGAELVLFPSYYEGFGFVPFEAAALGTACAYTHRSSMRELLPAVGALPSFELDAATRFVFALLESREARAAVVEGVNAVAANLTWDRAAAGYNEVYERAVAREPRGVSRELLSLVPGPESVLKTRNEVVLVDVYRRRRGFRVATDAVLTVGNEALRGARRLRRRGSGSTS